MSNQQLLDYIKQQLQRGIGKEEIKNVLLAQGWQEKDIDEAFNLAGQPEQSQPYSEPKTLAKTSKKLITLIVSVILGIIIGGGVFGYYYYFQSPKRIVQKITGKMAKVKSLEYTGQIMAEIETSNLPAFSSLGNGNFLQSKKPSPVKQTGKFSIDFNGKSDLNDLNNPRVTFKFDINTNILPQSYGLEIRTIKNIIYLKLSNIPDYLSNVPGYLKSLNLSILKNQWIKFDLEAIKKQFELVKFGKQLEEIQKKQELSPEQIKQIKEVVARTKIFKITGKLPNEKINGVNTHHYKFVIEKEGLIQLFTEMDKIIKNKSLTEKELQELNKTLEVVEMPAGEIWIGKKDLLLYKILLSLDIKGTKKIKSKGRITTMVQFKNYNKPIKIDIPTSVKTPEEILSEWIGGGFLQSLGLGPNHQLPEQQPQQLPGKTIDFSKDSDNDGLADELEKIYGTNPNNPDTDGDGFKDGEEVDKGYNPKGPGKLFE